MKNGESWEDILVNLDLQDDIIFSYNNYFRKKPYSWFGNKYDPQNGKGGRVEAFLNGLNASLYDSNEFKYTAIHLDLFPFATMSDFTDIEKELKIVSRDLFDTHWAQNFLTKLISFINPETIIVFGRTNFEDYFKEYFRESILTDIKDTYKYVTNNNTKKRTYWLGSYNETIKLAGVSVNLGNPTGMNEYKVLYKFGEHIRQQLKNK